MPQQSEPGVWEPLHPLSGQSPGQGVLATASVTWALAYLLLQQDIHMGFADHNRLMGSGWNSHVAATAAPGAGAGVGGKDGDGGTVLQPQPTSHPHCNTLQELPGGGMESLAWGKTPPDVSPGGAG